MIVKSINDLLAGRDTAQIDPEASVKEACMVLNLHNVGALAVMDGARLVGVLSERDVIRKCICGDRRTAETKVREVMTADPVTVDACQSLTEALGLMLDGRFRHLPVVSAGELVGMLSIRDIPTEYRLMLERFREYRAPAA